MSIIKIIIIYIITEEVLRKMKQTILIVAGILAFTRSALIVDREFNVKHLAEGIPLTVTYTLYNTFGRYKALSI